jgi:hypothetical protein
VSDIEPSQFLSAVTSDVPPAFIKVVSADVRPDGLMAVVLSLLNPGEPSETPEAALCRRSGNEWIAIGESTDGVDGVWEYSDNDWVAVQTGCSHADRVNVRFGNRTASVPVRGGWFQAVFWPDGDGPPPAHTITVQD